jgi:hypothetical protein
MIKGFLSLLNLGALLPQVITGLFGWLNKKQDTQVVENNNSAAVSTAIVQAETSRLNAASSLITAMLAHPIWWAAWALGVFPVMLYYASIFWVSTFPFWGWTVLQAPADALEFAKLVVGSMFTIGGASTLVAGIAHAWERRA